MILFKSRYSSGTVTIEQYISYFKLRDTCDLRDDSQVDYEIYYQKVNHLLNQPVNYYFRPKKRFFALSIASLFLLLLISFYSTADPIVNSGNKSPTADTDWIKTSVKKGDNLSIIFKRVGLTAKLALQVNHLSSTEKTFVRMIPGETLSFLIVAGKLQQIRYDISKTTTTVLSFNASSDKLLISREVKQPLTAVIQADQEPSPNSNATIEQPVVQPPALTQSTPKQSAPKQSTPKQSTPKEPTPKEVVFEAIDPSQYSHLQRKVFTVSLGNTLTRLFLKAGLSASHAINVSNAQSDTELTGKIFTKLVLGDQVTFLIVDNSLLEFSRTTADNQVFTALKAIGTKNTYLVSESQTELASSVIDTDTDADADADADRLSLEAAIGQVSTAADNWVYYTVQKDDNLSAIFFRAGLSSRDVHYVDNAAKQDAIFNRMLTGQKVAFLIRGGHLIKMKYIIGPFKSIVFTRLDELNYQLQILEREPVISRKHVAGSITNSLFVDALNAGLSSNMVMNFTKVFAWDVDFSQDIQPGDKFKLVYEEMMIDGTKIKNGNIIAAQFTTGGKNLIGIFYRDSAGDVGFYTPDGTSMRKAFLRMPVEFARISSKFNPRRRHPILKTVRPHRGVDYAAKRGTPIMASGNGRIIYRSRRGDYGKTIIIQHGTSINTLYAHMSNYARGLKVGSRVTQGQTIGYIGATGAVTGAHLHYEFRVDGVHKNPLTIKLPKAISLDPKEMRAFNIVARDALKQLDFANSDDTKAQKLATNQIDTEHDKPL